MDPFILSRNAFNLYCSKYMDTNPYDKVVEMVNQRYEYFLQTLDRLQQNQNINSSLLSVKSKHKIKKSYKRQMPKIFITVSCNEHKIKQQPNIKLN